MKPDEAITLVTHGYKQLAASLAEGRSDTLRSYLALMAKFHRYSIGNLLMIHEQFPSATKVAGYRKWQELGRQVRAGERGIAIYAPVRRTDKDAQRKIALDGLVGHAVLGYRIVYVFDVSQTKGKPLVELSQVSGDPGPWLERLEHIARKRRITLHYVDFLHGTKGTSNGRTVCIDTRLAPADKFLTLLHELAHVAQHHNRRRYIVTSTVRETEAEAVAFVVSQAIGLDCLAHSADYIQLYRGDCDTLRESMYLIRKTAAGFIDSLQSIALTDGRGVVEQPQGADHQADSPLPNAQAAQS